MSRVGISYQEYRILAEGASYDGTYRNGTFRGVECETVMLVEMSGLCANQYAYAQKVLQVVNTRKYTDGRIEYFNPITFPIRPKGHTSDDPDKCEEAMRLWFKRTFGFKA